MENLNSSDPFLDMFESIVSESSDMRKSFNQLYAHISYFASIIAGNKFISGDLPARLFFMRCCSGLIVNDTDKKRNAYMKDPVIVSNLKKYGLNDELFWFFLLFLSDYIEGFDGGRYDDSVDKQFIDIMKLFSSKDDEIPSIQFGKVKKSDKDSVDGSNNSKDRPIVIDSGTPQGRETIRHIGMAICLYYQRYSKQIDISNKEKGLFPAQRFRGKTFHLSKPVRCTLFVIYTQRYLRTMTLSCGKRAPAGEWTFLSHLFAVLYPQYDEKRKLSATGSHNLKKNVTPKSKDSAINTEIWVENRHYPRLDFSIPLHCLI